MLKTILNQRLRKQFFGSLIQITQKDYIELKCQAAYWKTQHERVVGREEILKEQLKQKDARISNLKQHLDGKDSEKARADNLQIRYEEVLAQTEILKEEIQHKDAIIKDLNQRLYGKTSEKSGSKADVNPNEKNKTTTRSRGHQAGGATHGRTQRPDLPVIPEVIPLNETACEMCGLDYSILSSYEESDIIEIKVAAHIRGLSVKNALKIVRASASSKIITAALYRKLIPRSPFGNSIWAGTIAEKISTCPASQSHIE